MATRPHCLQVGGACSEENRALLAPPQTLTVTVIHSFIHSFNHQLRLGYLLCAERGLGTVEMVANRADDGLSYMKAGHRCYKENLSCYRGQCLEDFRSVTLIKLGGRPVRDLRKHLSLKEAASRRG